MDKFLNEGYSRIPVYSKDLDNVIGIIYAKDIISVFKHRDVIILHDILRKPFFVNENDYINTVLKQMQTNKVHLAIVLDEFGGTAGIVSLEDILEELVGEIQDEYDEETPQFVKLNDKSFQINASLPVVDVNELLPIPLPESEDYETIGGLIITELGRIPDLGEKIKINNYIIEILSSTNRKIELIKLQLNEEEIE